MIKFGAIASLLFLVLNTRAQLSDIDASFSVSDEMQVCFSKGNLQYQPSTNTWRFAEHQWDICGYHNSNMSPNNSEWIDLFGWGTGNDPTKTSENNADYSTFSDWGNNCISNGGNYKWRTLTTNEWLYVISKRKTDSGIRYAKATVKGMCGVILLPDSWCPIYYYLSKANTYDADYNSNCISEHDWIRHLESNGAIFLPAANSRRGKMYQHLPGGHEVGRYWSSTIHEYDQSFAYDMCFYNWILYGSDSYCCHLSEAISVRLVREVITIVN